MDTVVGEGVQLLGEWAVCRPLGLWDDAARSVYAASVVGADAVVRKFGADVCLGDAGRYVWGSRRLSAGGSARWRLLRSRLAPGVVHGVVLRSEFLWTEQDEDRWWSDGLLALDGDLEWDADAGRFRRFDVAAAGLRWGGTKYNSRRGDFAPAPVGYWIELADGSLGSAEVGAMAESDRTPPWAIGWREYFDA